MSDTRYTADHEWVRLDGDIVTVGITAHATEALGRYSVYRVARN